MIDNSAIVDFTSRLIEAPRTEEVWRIYCAAMETAGFTGMFYCATRFPGAAFLGNLHEALLLQHGTDAYLDEELYVHSPTVAWAEQHTGFVSWAEAARTRVAEATASVMRIDQLNAEFGCVAGYVGSLKGVVPGMKGVVGLSAGRGVDQGEIDAMWAECGGDVETLTKLLHVRIAGLPQPLLLRPLTKRQREVLDWYGQGKTTSDIAIIMGLSVATVEKHMRAAREALNATTTAHAVKKAAALNLLVH